MDRLWAPWRMQWIENPEPPEDGCILCAIPRDTHPQSAHVVERAATTYTVLNRYPYSSGHLMVIPLRHVAHVTDLPDDESAALMHGAQRAVRALQACLQPHGFNLGINHGRGAGAGIDEHVHLHVVPGGTATPTSCRCWPTCMSCPRRWTAPPSGSEPDSPPSDRFR